jgi:hypothetical protein
MFKVVIQEKVDGTNVGVHFESDWGEDDFVCFVVSVVVTRIWQYQLARNALVSYFKVNIHSTYGSVTG